MADLDVKKTIENAINFPRILLRTSGLWPPDILYWKESNSVKHKVIWVLRSTLMVYHITAVITELMYLFLLEDPNVVLVIECIITMLVELYNTAIIFTLYWERDKFIFILDTLMELLNVTDLIYNDNVQKTSRRSYILTYVLWALTSACVGIYMFIPMWLAHEETAHTNSTAQRVLPYHSWYPYDTDADPFYQISFSIEMFRGSTILNMITGSDGLLAMTLFFTCDQFSFLRLNLEDIIRKAMSNVERDANGSENNQDLLDEEVNKIFKVYAKRHAVLNELAAKEADVYGAFVFLHYILHSSVLCSVQYSLLLNIKIQDYWNCMKYFSFQLILLIQLFMYGYIGSQLITESTSISDGCFYSKWYMSGSSEFKRSLYIMIHRSQKACKLTAFKFTVMSLEIVITILSSSASYLTLLNTLQDEHD